MVSRRRDGVGGGDRRRRAPRAFSALAPERQPGGANRDEKRASERRVARVLSERLCAGSSDFGTGRCEGTAVLGGRRHPGGRTGGNPSREHLTENDWRMETRRRVRRFLGGVAAVALVAAGPAGAAV